MIFYAEWFQRLFPVFEWVEKHADSIYWIFAVLGSLFGLIRGVRFAAESSRADLFCLPHQSLLRNLERGVAVIGMVAVGFLVGAFCFYVARSLLPWIVAGVAMLLTAWIPVLLILSAAFMIGLITSRRGQSG